MNVDRILSKLITQYQSFPVVKLVWDGQIDLCVPELPKLSPSNYIQEASLTTTQRFALLEKQHRTLEQWTPDSELTVVPSVVVFQGYSIGDSPSVTITIRNISKNTQKVTLLMDEDGLFTIDKNSKRVARFPPGMSFTTTIRFKADDDNCHYHKIVFVTKSSRFVIPITALGSRGMMDAPDAIDFGRVPVKYLQTKTFPICNIGKKTARFTLITDGPFSASPEKGVVLSKDSFNLLVSFLSDTCAEAQGGLRIKYENGEEVHINLKAEAVNCPIKISPIDLEFPDTYIGLKAKLLIVVRNDSDIKVTFKWRKYISQSASAREGAFEHVHHEGGGGDTGEPTPVAQNRLYSHGDSIEAAQLLPEFGESTLPGDLEPLYSDDSFAVEPPMGVIQPHCSRDIYVFFSPTRTGIYISDIFCDITGLEERSEIRITGRGLGPKFRLGFDELDIGTIFLGGGHTYEIPVTNVSEIEGALIFDSVAGLMPQAGVMVEPLQMNVAPGHYSAFFMYFNCNGKPGLFYEELRFRVPVTGQVVNLSVRGRMAYPDMHFSTSLLEFGNLSYGYPKTAQVVVVNDSLNHVQVVLKVNRDGTERVLTQEQIMATFLEDDVDFPENPREFGIDPETFQITPRGFQRISVTLTPGSYGDYERELLVCTEDNEIISSIEMKGKCVPPTLIKGDNVITLKNIYRHVPYTMNLHVRNPSEMYGIFCCIPRPAAKMKIESEGFIGIAQPFETTEIPINVTCTKAGDLNGFVDLYLVGLDEPVMEFEVKCHVISAAFVDVSTRLIHMGNINVEEVGVTHFDIINKCPQNVPFKLALSKADVDDVEWKIYPEEGEITPKNKMNITVEVTLREAGDRACIVRAYLNQGLTFLDVKVKVRGIGCSLGVCPPLDRSGRIDFGSLFLKTYKSFTYQITNHGHLDKIMDWRHLLDEPPTNKPELPPEKNKPMKQRQPVIKRGPPAPKPKKEIEPSFKPMKTVFEIQPRKKLLRPGETMTVEISTEAPVAKLADETYILWAYTPRATGQARRELLAHMQLGEHLSKNDLDEMIENQQCFDPVQARHVNLVGLFERAALEYSSRDLLFKIEAAPSQDTFEIKNELTITNSCTLPLKAEFKTAFPFSMSAKHNVLPAGTTEFSHMFEPGESVAMIISFDGSHLRKERGSLYFESQMDVVYVGHAGREVIRLRGEVHFPGVDVDRDYIDFGVVINGTEAVQEFLVTNKCNFCVTYKMYIKPKSTTITRTRDDVLASSSQVDSKSAIDEPVGKKSKKGKSKSPKGSKGKGKSKSKSPKRGSRSKSPKRRSKSKSPKSKSKSPKKGKKSKPKERDPLDEPFPIYDGEEAKFLSSQEKPTAPGTNESEELLYDPRAHQNDSELNLNQTSEFVQFLREKMYRARMMDMMGLRDPEREIDDEMTYLQAYPVLPTTVNHVAPAEVVDIVPMAGVLQAGQTQRFTVVFYAKSDISFKTVLCCFIEGGTPAFITVTGHSAPAPTMPVHKVTSEELRDNECRPRPTLHQQEVDRKLVETCAQRNKNSYKFTTHVRKNVTRVVPVTNKTHKREILHPTFAGRYFSGDTVLSIPPMSTVEFTINYHPLEMTRSCKERHMGSVFFLMSSGAVTLYNFVGLATSPEAEGKITIEVRCREPWTQKLPVNNWLDIPQRFIVKNEVISHAIRKTSTAGATAFEPDLHEFLFLVGHEAIEVSANEHEDYLLHFIAYREGVFSYRVTFTNKAHEFLYYDLTFKVTRPDILETINIDTTVREKVIHEIILENPLQIEALVRSHTAVHGARVIPKKTTISPKSKCTLIVECIPLFPGKFEGVIDIVSPELGSYPYHIAIDAKAAPPEPTTFFTTSLSIPCPIELRITNFCTKKVDFKLELNSNVFTVKEPYFTVEKRSQGKLEVEYEPCGLGVSTATLMVTSSHGGTYEFPLHGTCAPPRPEGSFLVRERQHLTIQFKNPLFTKATFHIQVDPPFFLVGMTPKTLELKARHSFSIVVGVHHHVKLASLMAAVPTTAPTVVHGTSVAKTKKKKKNAKDKEKETHPAPTALEPVSIALDDLPERVVINQDWEDFIVGRLVVTCNTVPGEDGKESVARWVYYLQGIMSDRMKPRHQVAGTSVQREYTEEETEGEDDDEDEEYY